MVLKFTKILKYKIKPRKKRALPVVVICLLKHLAKKGYNMDWLHEFYLFFRNTSRRPLPVSSETVLYRREYFSLKMSKNFTRTLQQCYYKLVG